MLVEEQRYIHEDLERLEQGIADRLREEPKPSNIRDRLNRDHEISQLLDQIQRESAQLLDTYRDAGGLRSDEIRQISSGDPFEEFYRQVAKIRDHHARYPNEQAENLELRYRPNPGGVGGENLQPSIADRMFSGEEAFGRFFDLHNGHEGYLNLPGVKRLTYLQYLEVFDNFTAPAPKRSEKLTDLYFRYVRDLADYLETFIRRTRPLENLDKMIASFDADFERAWDQEEIEGWEAERSKKAAAKPDGATKTLSSAEAVWCEACAKEFTNENVYNGHLQGRKHIKNAEQLAQRRQEPTGPTSEAAAPRQISAHRLKERAVAEREYRVKRLVSAMSTEREDTRVNVERRQGMTERERQQELENLFSSTGLDGWRSGAQGGRGGKGGGVDDDDEAGDGEDRIYNPLKLPLAWDGKPIPFWLYRLHGLGVEFPCEICGNFVYMGRRAFEKHFNEARHIMGLKCLGISNTHLFRDITGINEAVQLWDKIQRDEKKSKVDDDSIVQMEDADGNVMPERVYYDLQKQGIL